MSIETELRTALARAADTEPFRPLYGPALRHRARNGRVRRLVLATAAATAAVVAVVAAVLFVPGPPSTVPAAGGYLSWPARGELAGDPRYTAAAFAGWDRSPLVEGHAPHTGMRVLYATMTAAFGPIAVLTGRDAEGERRVAVVTGSPYERTFPGAMSLVYDQAAPPVGTRALVLYSFEFPVPMVVVAEPDVATITYTGEARGGGREHGTLHGGGGAGWAARTTMYPEFFEGRTAQGRRRFKVGVHPHPSIDYAGSGPRSVGDFPRPAVPWYRPVGRLDRVDPAWSDKVAGAAAVRDGYPYGAATYQSLWARRLPDGTDLYANLVNYDDAKPAHLVVGTKVGGYVDLYVDRQYSHVDTIGSFAVVVRGVAHDWLVVVGRPGETPVSWAADGTAFTPLTLDANAAVVAVGRGAVTSAARVRFAAHGTTRTVPLDAVTPI